MAYIITLDEYENNNTLIEQLWHKRKPIKEFIEKAYFVTYEYRLNGKHYALELRKLILSKDQSIRLSADQLSGSEEVGPQLLELMILQLRDAFSITFVSYQKKADDILKPICEPIDRTAFYQLMGYNYLDIKCCLRLQEFEYNIAIYEKLYNHREAILSILREKCIKVYEYVPNYTVSFQVKSIDFDVSEFIEMVHTDFGLKFDFTTIEYELKIFYPKYSSVDAFYEALLDNKLISDENWHLYNRISVMLQLLTATHDSYYRRHTFFAKVHNALMILKSYMVLVYSLIKQSTAPEFKLENANLKDKAISLIGIKYNWADVTYIRMINECLDCLDIMASISLVDFKKVPVSVHERLNLSLKLASKLSDEITAAHLDKANYSHANPFSWSGIAETLQNIDKTIVKLSDILDHSQDIYLGLTPMRQLVRNLSKQRQIGSSSANPQDD